MTLRASRLEELGRLSSSRPFYVRHIPKTGGTSVRVWLHDVIGIENVAPAGMLDQFFIGASQDHPYDAYAAHCHGYLDEIIGLRTTQSTVLREPQARTYSHWLEICRSKYHPHHERVVRQEFGEFVDDPSNAVFIRNVQARYLAPPRIDVRKEAAKLSCRELEAYALSQRAEDVSLEWSDTELLEGAKATLGAMAVVGTVDRLHEFLLGVAACLNLPEPAFAAVPHANLLAGGRVEAVLSYNQRERLKELTAVDRILYDDILNR